VVVVERLGFDERLLGLDLALEVALREGRPVVGQRLVAREEREASPTARLAIGLDRARGRQPAADDDNVKVHSGPP
jgi:hypothetical protein